MGTEGAAGAGAGSTTEGAGSTAGQPDYKSLWETAQKEALEYKERFGGLQGKYQQEKGKWDEALGQIPQLQGKLTALTGEKEALALQVSAEATEKARIAGELAKAAAKVERVGIIAKEFAHLLPFEVDGLLPDGTGDDLKGKLQTFSERLSGMSKETIADFKKGGTPPPPAEPPVNTSAALFKQATAALREGKQTDYDRLYDQALALQKQGK